SHGRALGRSQGCRSYRVHRIARSGFADLGNRRQNARRSARTQARHLRNGRQERRDHRRGRRSRRSDRGHDLFGVRLSGAKMFGQVLSVIKARDLDEAFEIANGTEFALTAGFFSRSPANIERAKAEIVAGNVYINRSCTGAVVGRHPFGGFKMSGGGTKAGGADYLLQFVVPRVVTENITRHGFAPETTPQYRDEFLGPRRQ